MKKPTGSKKAPKAEGYYWFEGKPKHRGKNAYVVEVISNGDDLDFNLHGDELVYSAKHFKGTWYGPINLPAQLKK